MFKIGDKVKVVSPFIPLETDSEHVISKVLPGLFVEVDNNPKQLFATECFELVQEEVDPELTPHKHAKVIKAWADGAKVQVKTHKDADWAGLNAHPHWIHDVPR